MGRVGSDSPGLEWGEMMTTLHTTAGRIRFSPGALAALLTAGTTPAPYLHRHLCGDYGELDPEDRRLNDADVRRGDGRVLSAYTLPSGACIWIITNLVAGQGFDTCILLPEEY
jgi:hypothetical protein